jgi:hypothetical protein
MTQLDYETPTARSPRMFSSSAAAMGFIAGGLVTVPFAFLGMMSAGAGHGDYFYARLLFPVALALTCFTHSISFTAVLIQWPLYGFWMFGLQARSRWICLVVVAIAHVTLFFVASSNGNFT